MIRLELNLDQLHLCGWICARVNSENVAKLEELDLESLLDMSRDAVVCALLIYAVLSGCDILTPFHTRICTSRLWEMYRLVHSLVVPNATVMFEYK